MSFGTSEELNFSDFSVSIIYIITSVVFMIKCEIWVCGKKCNMLGGKLKELSGKIGFW